MINEECFTICAVDTYQDRIQSAMSASSASVSALARALGVSYQAVKKVVDGSSKAFSAENNAVAADFLKVDPTWLATGSGDMRPPVGSHSAPIALDGNPDYPAVRRVRFKLSAGASGFGVEYRDDEDGAPIVFRRDWFEARGLRPERLFAVHVANGSMEPGLADGDTVVVNTAQTDPRDGVVFAVNYEGELVIKRLVRDAGQWWLASDNPDQRRYPRKLADEHSIIIGEIVHKQSERI